GKRVRRALPATRQPSGLRAGDGIEPPFADAFQLMGAAVLECDLRAGYEILDRARDEDLARQRRSRDARADGHGDSGWLVPHQLASRGGGAGGDPGPGGASPRKEWPRPRAPPRRAVKDGEEAVPRRVDLLAVELTETTSDECVMLLEQRSPGGVAEGGGTFGRA